jgi:hypothetical protein
MLIVLSFTPFGFKICMLCHHKFLSFKWLMPNIYLFSVQIGMPRANSLNSIGYMDTVLFLTIGKPDISA